MRPSDTVGPRAFGWAPGMSRCLDEFQPDVADTQHLWYYPSVATLGWSRRNRKPYVVTPRGMLDSWALCRSQWKKRFVHWLFEGEHLRRAACIRALNKSELSAIRAFGLRNPVAVVPLGIELPENVHRRRIEGGGTLLFLGRIDPKKAVQELVRGWSLSNAAARGWRLRIVGWGDARYVDATRRLVQDLSLHDSVELVGPAFGELKDRAFREADAFILPSHSEGLPRAVLEAWSYALPVLMTRFCNVPEGFERGAALEIGTEPARIAEGIRQLVAMPANEREAMGQTGRRLVEEGFSSTIEAQRMSEVYEWVTGGGSPPSLIDMPEPRRVRNLVDHGRSVHRGTAYSANGEE